MSEIPYSGGCLCGAVRYRVEKEPIWVGYCHCQSCRKNIGAPVAAFVGVNHGAFFDVSGERAEFVSSPGVKRGFCNQCGTPLTYQSDRWPSEIHIYISTLDHPNQFEPEFHVHCGEKIEWFETADKLERFLKSSDD